MDVELRSLKNIEKMDSFSPEMQKSIKEALKHNLFCVKSINDDGSVFLYGMDESSIAIPESALDKKIFYKKGITATSKDNQSFSKELSIYEDVFRDRMIISFEGLARYELDLFMENYNKNNISDLCIDAGGRNHGSDSVWVKKEDIKKLFLLMSETM